MRALATVVLILGSGLLVSGRVLAAEDAYAPVRESLKTCFTCHGENGASTRPRYPILAGQHLYYLYVQLKDFKAGLRTSPEMSPVAAGLSKKQMRLIAKFFSEQRWPRIGYRADPEKEKRGEMATIAGECVQCHRGGYEGDSRIPRLAGQHARYLNKTMADFKAKKRNNSPSKSALLETFGADEIADMAEFLAGM